MLYSILCDIFLLNPTLQTYFLSNLVYISEVGAALVHAVSHAISKCPDDVHVSLC